MGMARIAFRGSTMQITTTRKHARSVVCATVLLLASSQAFARDVFDTFGDTCIDSGTSYDKAAEAVKARNAVALPAEPNAGYHATKTYLVDGTPQMLITLNERGYCAVMADATQAADLQAQLTAFMEAVQQSKPATQQPNAPMFEGEQVLATWEIDWSPELEMRVRLSKASADGVEGVMLSRAFVAK
jgi:hypothetical protein